VALSTVNKYEYNNHRARITNVDTGPAEPEHSLFCIYLFIYCQKFRENLTAVSFHRRRRQRRPMTTIPTRLARAATSSTSSVHQRKRVLDLYREWMRGVRLLFSAFCLLSPFYPLVISPTRPPKSAHYTPSTSRPLQYAPLFATALRRIAMCRTRS
jgi:hypothetical protein